MQILSAYESEGNEFIDKGLKDPLYLEKISGLKAMKDKMDDEIMNITDDEFDECDEFEMRDE
jgi:hypothetical protein